MSKLLSDTIRELKLDANSPYPFQALRNEVMRNQRISEIRNWRESQRLKLVQEERTNDDEFGGGAA